MASWLGLGLGEFTSLPVVVDSECVGSGAVSRSCPFSRSSTSDGIANFSQAVIIQTCSPSFTQQTHPVNIHISCLQAVTLQVPPIKIKRFSDDKFA
ncbi:hypothetical protein BDW75DRAFT_142206 [Aspergillus navahoensis]